MACNFSKPLLCEDSVDREINSIESEFQMVSSNDIVRILQTLQSNTADPNNIFNRFQWGNKHSLRSEREDDLLTDLRSFFDNQYSADRMKLVI